MLNKPKLTALLLVPLLAFLVLKGILPGFTIIQTDFPNYYTSGSIARTGEGVERLYDDEWFQDQIHEHGMPVPGKFSPFPPTTAILFIPFSYLAPLAAQQAMNVLNIIFLLCAIYILSRLFSATLLESTVFVLLSGWGLANNFRFGQLYLALTLSILLGFYLQERQKQTAAGFSFGLLLPVKYFSVVMVIHSMIQKNWRVVLSALITTAVICLLSIWILGWHIHAEFLRSVIAEHLQSNLSQQNPFSLNFQSFDSLLRRLFLFDENLNPQPLYASHVLFLISKIICVGGAVVAAVYSLYHLNKKESGLQVAVLSLLVLLIAPATATYHFVLLWLPVGILLQHFLAEHRTNHFLFTLVLYTGIGFFPYSFFRRFEDEGVLTVLAYPRLLLLAALFTLAILEFSRHRKTV